MRPQFDRRPRVVLPGPGSGSSRNSPPEGLARFASGVSAGDETPADVDVFRVEGTIVHSGSRLATAEARLVDRSGALYANASSSALVLAHEATPSLAA